jgi:hypothetical protein
MGNAAPCIPRRPRGQTAARRCVALVSLALLAAATGCAAPGEADRQAREAELEARLAPGLHTLMTELQFRHANLWFAGEAENWPLAAHQVHELEELLERTAAFHPVYRDVPVGELLEAITASAVAALEASVEAGDAVAFRAAFDDLTLRCNTCHTATGRDAIVIQRPTAPPLTNLRYAPAAE